jgi:choline dehydrogenase-like flavoprotein
MGMWAPRGLKADFESWGEQGWTYDDLLPFFIKLENDLDFNGMLHGSDGPIPISRPNGHHGPALLKPSERRSKNVRCRLGRT